MSAQLSGRVILYARQGCHLCDAARDVVTAAARSGLATDDSSGSVRRTHRSERNVPTGGV